MNLNDPTLRSARGLAKALRTTPIIVTEHAKACGIKNGPYRNSAHQFSPENIVTIMEKHCDHMEAELASINRETATIEAKIADMNSERLRQAKLMAGLADLVPLPGFPSCQQELLEIRAALKNVPATPPPGASYEVSAKYKNALAHGMLSIAAIQKSISAKLSPKTSL